MAMPIGVGTLAAGVLATVDADGTVHRAGGQLTWRVRTSAASGSFPAPTAGTRVVGPTPRPWCT